MYRTLIAALLFAWPAAAQTFPDKPIRFIVPFGAGGATDFIARSFAAKAAEMTGWSIVVDNRPGAGGNIGSDAVAKAAPDGLTWLLGSVGILATNQFLYDQLPFDPEKDFRLVGMVASLPNLMVVNPAIPAKTLAEFLAYARAKPDGLTYSSSGNGTTSHLSGALVRAMSGANLIHVPYRNAGQAHTDVIAGRVDFTIDNMPVVLPFAQSGQMVPLAVTGATRSAQLPQVPTMAEAGLAGYEATSWFALMLPAAVRPEIVAQIEPVVRRVLADPQLRTIWGERGIAAGDRYGAELTGFAAAERGKWREVIERAQIKLQ